MTEVFVDTSFWVGVLEDDPTDCYSMVVMKQRNIREVLSYDEHFQQEGFIALMR
jgi:predicted nucleic acid-binding protein